MTSSFFFSFLLCAMFAGCASPHLTEKDLKPLDAAQLTDDSIETLMAEDDLIDFFSKQTKGTSLRVVLRNGKTVWGRFSSFDEYYQTVWIIPQQRGFLTTRVSFKIGGIRNTRIMEQEQEKATSPYKLISPEDMGGK